MEIGFIPIIAGNSDVSFVNMPARIFDLIKVFQNGINKIKIDNIS